MSDPQTSNSAPIAKPAFSAIDPDTSGNVGCGQHLCNTEQGLCVDLFPLGALEKPFETLGVHEVALVAVVTA